MADNVEKLLEKTVDELQDLVERGIHDKVLQCLARCGDIGCRDERSAWQAEVRSIVQKRRQCVSPSASTMRISLRPRFHLYSAAGGRWLSRARRARDNTPRLHVGSSTRCRSAAQR